MPSFTSATPCRTFSRVTRFMRPRWSSGPNSPQLEPAGLLFHLIASVSVVVVPPDPFGDQDRLVAAFALDERAPRHLHAAFELVELRQREARPHARPGGQRRGEAHPVQAVVDAH